MSDQQPLSLKETFDIYNSTLRLVGAANATGAIAAGAAFQAFEKTPAAQSFIKYVALVFLLGVLAFTFSSAALFIAQREFDSYLASRPKERADWEKIISGITKNPPRRTFWLKSPFASGGPVAAWQPSTRGR